MDFPTSGGPTKMVRVTSTDTEPCFLRESSYADRHSKKARSRGLCAMTDEGAVRMGICLALRQVKCE